jgi:hypothetical protein
MPASQYQPATLAIWIARRWIVHVSDEVPAKLDECDVVPVADLRSFRDNGANENREDVAIGLLDRVHAQTGACRFNLDFEAIIQYSEAIWSRTTEMLAFNNDAFSVFWISGGRQSA